MLYVRSALQSSCSRVDSPPTKRPHVPQDVSACRRQTERSLRWCLPPLCRSGRLLRSYVLYVRSALQSSCQRAASSLPARGSAPSQATATTRCRSSSPIRSTGQRRRATRRLTPRSHPLASRLHLAHILLTRLMNPTLLMNPTRLMNPTLPVPRSVPRPVPRPVPRLAADFTDHSRSCLAPRTPGPAGMPRHAAAPPRPAPPVCR